MMHQNYSLSTRFPFLKNLLLGFIVTTLFIVTVGCSTDISLLSAKSDQSQFSAERYMELARGAAGESALEYRLRAAESFIQANKIEEAGLVFREAQTAKDNSNGDVQNKLLEARLALINDDGPHALAIVHQLLHTITLNKQTPSAFGSNASTASTPYSENRGKKIALLLPSKGAHAEAAKTIREGFFAAFYKSQQQHQFEPSIKVYDTGDGKAVETAYQQAISDNADMIVGPLTKTEVKTIANRPSSVPILALNAIDGKSPSNLFQFGLLPEDEVQAVVLHAKQQGHKRAVVIAPKNDWGQRMSKAFSKAWVANGGQIVSTVILKNNDTEEQSAQIESLFRLGKDKKAKRKDVDMVFLAASNDLGRKIRPLVGFYASAKLPIYATANIYSGTPMPSTDHDLDGICFCDMPWVLNNSGNSGNQNSPPSTRPQKLTVNALNTPRFFALGLDAFQLARQLNGKELKAEGSFATGDLRLEGQRIQRRLHCAKFVNGVPVPE